MLDIFTDDNFRIPFDLPAAPSCPVCDGAVRIDVFERDDDTGLPSDCGFHVWCEAQGEFNVKPTHRDWDYQDLITVIDGVREWLKAECERRRSWEICLWGESEIPALNS